MDGLLVINAALNPTPSRTMLSRTAGAIVTLLAMHTRVASGFSAKPPIKMGSSRPKGAVLSGDLAVTTRPKDAASSTGTTAPVPYWYNPQIHTFGNIGLGGFFHALMAPLATAVIDRASYGGLDVRKVAHDMIGTDKTVLDLCCGVGFSTMEGGHAIDTSPMMLNVARFHRPDLSFSFGNAETYGDTQGYDVVTIMYAMHEMPGDARKRVLANMMRVARESVVIVDIHPEFQETLAKKPMNGEFFLMGEPYVLEYLTNIDTDVFSAAATHENRWSVRRVTMLAGHVVMYRLDRA